MDNVHEMGLVEIDDQTLEQIEGGFVALTILGVTYTATQVATAAGALFIAGIGAGVAAASASD
ncbi:hypothetical protein [Fodinibius sediminis]|uniref:Class IIb bacteriocin, lactobin A/cerein 7B family n=1 Tax=Fodinibius sediminis TaxID=1214077 RepID=A0A521EL43_9BACT|nr:hypothetical protein [Fodinibius sediminis]SMO84602.1 hypothetical protein SAMN06265218_11723 [Fodinibius sediminis]